MRRIAFEFAKALPVEFGRRVRDLRLRSEQTMPSELSVICAL
jgi:hypothetical protein